MRVLVWIAMLAPMILAQGNEKSDCEGYAGQLANPFTRAEAVERIAAKPERCMDTFMTWTESPPNGVDNGGLKVGLAYVFGRTRHVPAVQFLIKNVNITRFGPMPKNNSRSLREWQPAADALIRIGVVASGQVIAAASARVVSEERMAMIFVLSQIGGQEARSFLQRMRTIASFEKYWCEVGLGLQVE